MVTDEQLLVSYAGGDQTAFSVLIHRYQQELFAFLARFVADATAAEDLFQETFIQVHRNAKNFDAERKFRPWLFTIAPRAGMSFSPSMVWQDKAAAEVAMARVPPSWT